MSGQLDPGFGSQLMQLISHAPGHIGITSGARSSSEQAALYAKNPKLAARPGSSWHEKGLAADLNWADTATLQWAHQHAAEYGLYFPMSWEPWHVQPLWTQGRKSSATDQTASLAYTAPPDGHIQQDLSGQGTAGHSLGSFQSLLTAPENIATDHPFDNAMHAMGNMVGLPPGNTNVNPDGTTAVGGTEAKGLGRVTLPRTPLTGGYSTAYTLAVGAGATPAEARILAAIAGPESRYNTHAYNGNADTGDRSYGLWQINMLGKMGEDRARSWGLQSYDQLFDPAQNAKAAVSILRSQGFNAWTGYKSGAYRQYLEG